MQLIVVMSAYGLTCLFSPGSQIIVAAYVGWLMISLNIAFAVVSKRYEKYISGIRNGLITAYQIKDELEQRLTDIKEKSKDSTQTYIMVSTKENSSKNDVIILENPTPFCVEAKRRLEESFAIGYEQGSKSNVKRLTLRKK